MKTCPFCGSNKPPIFKVKDGDGFRVACEQCKDDDMDKDQAREPNGHGSDFLREVMTYQGTGDFY